jgi:hypothetical protein
MKKLIFALFACSFALHDSDALAKCSDYSNCVEVVNGWKAGDLKFEHENDNIPCKSICGGNGENMFKKVGSGPNSQSVGTAWSIMSTWYDEAPAKLAVAIGTFIADVQIWFEDLPQAFSDWLVKFKEFLN